MSSRRTRRLLSCAALSSLAFGSHVLAQVTSWTNPAGGTLNNAANWNNGVPGAGFTAVFNLNATYTATLNANASFAQLSYTTSFATFANNGTPRTMALSGSAFFASGTTVFNGVSLIGTTASGVTNTAVRGGARVSFLNGSTLNTQVLSIADFASVGSLLISGNGSSVNVTTTNDTTIASAGNASGSLTLQTNAAGTFGGALRMADAAVASFMTSTVSVAGTSSLTLGTLKMATLGFTNVASFSIDGSSIVTQTGAASFSIGGANNTATLSISLGCIFDSGSGDSVLRTGGQIINSGMFNLNGNLTIDGGNYSGFSGTCNFAASKTTTIQNNGAAFFSNLNLNGVNSAMVVNDTSILQATTAAIGANGGVATLTLNQSGAGTSFFGTVLVGALSGGGVLNMNSGSTIIGVSLGVGTSGVSGAAGTFNLSGTGSFLGGNLTVGAGSNSTGVVNMSNGTCSVSSLTVNSTGTLNLNGGTLNISSSFGMTGGVFKKMPAATLNVPNLSIFNVGACVTLDGVYQLISFHSF